MISIKFRPGQIVATPGALEALEAAGQEIDDFLRRHLDGDWGLVDEDDKTLNDLALVDGSRIMSAYETKTKAKLWIITEAVGDDAERASTCLLLPDEY